MLRLTNKIKIGDYEFNYVNQLEIKSGWDTHTDTATITIPKKITFKGKPIVDGGNALFKIGDKVQIDLGYNYTHDTVFHGFITQIKPNRPLVIECEDMMWLFKKVRYTKGFKSVTLKGLIDFLIQGDTKNSGVSKLSYYSPFEVVCNLDVSLGQFRMNDATGTEILAELREKYQIHSYFRNGVMYVGLKYSTDADYSNETELSFTKDIISDSLDFKNPENTTVNIKVKDKKFKAMDQALVKHIQQEQADKNKTTLKGTLTTFGKPVLNHGDKVKLINTEYPEKSGTYLISEITRSFGQEGYRQEISIDLKVS